MDTAPTFGITELVAHIVGDVAKAVSVRTGEPDQCQHDRAHAAAGAIMTFKPRDAIEAMLAGHCVMFHEMLVDSVNATLRSEGQATRHAARSGIVAMDRAFGNNLNLLGRYRKGHAGGAADTQAADDHTETEIADRVRRHRSGTEPRSHAASGKPAPEAQTTRQGPSIEAFVAGCDATIALDAADTARSGQSTEADRSNETWLAAQMAGLNRQTRRALDRQARKRLGPVAPAPAMPRLSGSNVTPTQSGPATTTSATTAG